MKANSNKCHLITSKQSCVNLKTVNINIENNTFKKLLDIKVDNKLNFNEHLNGMIKKASRKISALSRIFLHGLNETTLFSEFILHFTLHLLPSYPDVS